MGVGRQGWSGKWSSGQKAGAALAGQGETSSLHLLCDLGLLAGPLWARSALGHWNLELQDYNYRQFVASWAHLLMPGTAHWRPQGATESFTPRPECWGLTFSVIPGQCLGFLINTLRGLVAGMPCRQHFPPPPRGWSQQPRTPPPACSPKAPTLLNGHFVSCQRTAVCSAAPAPETSR